MRRLNLFPRKRRLDIYEVIAKHRDEVLRSEHRAIVRLRKAYEVAQRQLKRRLKALNKQIAAANALGVEISPAWLERQDRWRELLAELQRETLTFSGIAAHTSVDQQVRSIDLALKHLPQLTKATGVKAGFTVLPRQAFEHMVGQLTDGSPLANLFLDMGKGALKSARDTFYTGIALGENPNVIARNFVRRFKDETFKRAALIARTESLRAYRTAQQRNYAYNGDVVTGARVMCARDARSCYLCLAQDGKILEHGEQFATHPGCRCALVPVVRFVDRPYADGDSWLREQDDKYIVAKLGPTRAKLFKDGTHLSEFIKYTETGRWGKGVRPITLKELERVAA